MAPPHLTGGESACLWRSEGDQSEDVMNSNKIQLFRSQNRPRTSIAGNFLTPWCWTLSARAAQKKFLENLFPDAQHFTSTHSNSAAFYFRSCITNKCSCFFPDICQVPTNTALLHPTSLCVFTICDSVEAESVFPLDPSVKLFCLRCSTVNLWRLNVITTYSMMKL